MLSTIDMTRDTTLLSGTLELLILKALTTGERHGLGVASRVTQITGGAFEVGPGSLFPALHRMEDAGWLTSEWGASENGRRARYYTLTASGRRQLKVATREWERVVGAMTLALES